MEKRSAELLHEPASAGEQRARDPRVVPFVIQADAQAPRHSRGVDGARRQDATCAEDEAQQRSPRGPDRIVGKGGSGEDDSSAVRTADARMRRSIPRGCEARKKTWTDPGPGSAAEALSAVDRTARMPVMTSATPPARWRGAGN